MYLKIMYQPLEKSYICTFFGKFSSTKVDSTCYSYQVNKNLDTGSYFAINLVNFLAPKLIQHVIAIGSIKILIQAHILHKFGDFSSTKVDCNMYVIAIGSIKNLDTGSYFAINLVNFLAPKLIQHVIAIDTKMAGPQTHVLGQHVLCQCVLG